MNNTHTVKHLRRPGYENNTLRSLNTNRSVDDSIPKITGFKDNMNYQRNNYFFTLVVKVSVECAIQRIGRKCTVSDTSLASLRASKNWVRK